MREPEFLIWLQRLVGDWLNNGYATDVRRREDGWLEAASLEPPRSIPLCYALNEESILMDRPRQNMMVPAL